ncbi:MAG: CBS domain-containing protein [Gemmatimonadota bacterium]
MELLDVLPREHVVVPLDGATLREAVADLARHLAAVGAVSDAGVVEQGLSGARARDIVVIADQVALPHYRTDAVDRLVVGLGVAPEPLVVEGAEEEGPRPRIVALILAPPDTATLYLQTISALARLFRRDPVVEQLSRARSIDDVLSLPEFAGLRIQPRLTVRDIMVHRGQSVAPDTPLREAIDLMVTRRLRALPVVGEKREVLGIISEWDLMKALRPRIPRADAEGEEAASAPELKVRDIMSRTVLCLSEDMGLEEVASMMINKDVEQFPVTSEGKLTGFLTRGDIIRKLFGR